MPSADVQNTTAAPKPRAPRSAEAVLFFSAIVAILQCVSLVILLPVTSELSPASGPLDQAAIDRVTGALDVWGNVEPVALGTVVVVWIVTSVWLTSSRSFALAKAADGKEARFAFGPAWTWLGWVVPSSPTGFRTAWCETCGPRR